MLEIGYIPRGWERGEKLDIKNYSGVKKETGTCTIISLPLKPLAEASGENFESTFIAIKNTKEEVDAANKWIEWWRS